MNVKMMVEVAQKYLNEEVLDANDDPVELEQLKLVWFGQILGNAKCIVAFDPPNTGVILEVTVNREKLEFYVDLYEKQDNKKYLTDGNNILNEETPTNVLPFETRRDRPTSNPDI